MLLDKLIPVLVLGYCFEQKLFQGLLASSDIEAFLEYLSFNLLNRILSSFRLDEFMMIKVIDTQYMLEEPLPKFT